MNIVLDLDETLVRVSTTSTRDAMSVKDLNVKSKKTKASNYFQFTINGVTYYGCKRPHLDLFLENIFKKFQTVNIWTAATRPYAVHVLQAIMKPSQLKKLTYVFCREDLEVNSDGNITKPLAKMFQGIGGPPLDPNNTIMIDDRPAVVKHNQGNAIIIPPFMNNPNDIALAQLIVILDGILKNPGMVFSQYKNYFKLEDLTKD